MPVVTVELPSGEVKKVGIDASTTLKQVTLMLEHNPENIVIFSGRYDNELGTLIGSADNREFGMFNTSNIVIVDKTNISEKNATRFRKSQEQGWGGGRRRSTRRRSTRNRSTRRQH